MKVRKLWTPSPNPLSISLKPNGCSGPQGPRPPYMMGGEQYFYMEPPLREGGKFGSSPIRGAGLLLSALVKSSVHAYI